MLRECYLPSLLSSPKLTVCPPRLFPRTLRFACDLPSLVCLLFQQALPPLLLSLPHAAVV